jgi:hypothetical protein
MNELKRIIGKTISSVEKDFDGQNTYIIMKFKEGGKINICGYLSGGEDGVGQLSADYHGREIDIKKQGDDLIGSKIRVIEEDYDGENSYLRIKFDGGSELLLTSFSSDENATAKIDINVYESNNDNSTRAKLVKESLQLLNIQDTEDDDDFQPKNENLYRLRREFNALVKKFKDDGGLTIDEIFDEIYNIIDQDIY